MNTHLAGPLEAQPAMGYGILYACKSARAWWYSAWLRTLARFSRTYLGSFWLGLSNLLSVAVLGLVYGAVFHVKDLPMYVLYIGFGITAWGVISQATTSGASLFTARREQLVNYSLPALFYCMEEWAFQMQTFLQAFVVVVVAGSMLRPVVGLNLLTCAWLPLLNLAIFCLSIIILTAIAGSRFKDFGQLVPIVLQLLFLISPILYNKDGLKELAFLAEINIFYRILAPLRDAALSGVVDLVQQLVVLGFNLIILLVLIQLLKRLRYRLPLWV